MTRRCVIDNYSDKLADLNAYLRKIENPSGGAAIPHAFTDMKFDQLRTNSIATKWEIKYESFKKADEMQNINLLRTLIQYDLHYHDSFYLKLILVQ